MMKRHMTALLVALALAVTSLVFVATPAQAGGGNCFYHQKKWFLGVENVSNIRLARVELHTKGCQSGKQPRRSVTHHWHALDERGAISREIVANDWSVAGGVEWHLETPFQIHREAPWQTFWIIKGWFRECAVYKLPFLCGPTGEFHIHVTYTSDFLLRRTAASRWYFALHEGPYNGTPSLYDRRLAIYDSR